MAHNSLWGHDGHTQVGGYNVGRQVSVGLNVMFGWTFYSPVAAGDYSFGFYHNSSYGCWDIEYFIQSFKKIACNITV